MIDIVDEAQSFVGVASKRAAHRLGLWHYSIHCWIYRASGDEPASLFFQKRAADKDMFPNALDISAAGHYQHGESAEDGVREIAEELGLKVQFADLIDLGLRTEVVRVPGVLNREFCRVFMYETTQRAHEFAPGPEEVEGLVEIAVEDGLALFSGAVDRVQSNGIEYRNGRWEPYSGLVRVEDFIPRADPYYYKMFILARLASRGDRHLAV